jgi:TonB family protein
MPKNILIIGLIFFCNFCCLGQEATSQVNNAAQELQISSKQKPNYTDSARQKKVSGWVRLQVTFLANGEIGEVVYLAEKSKKKKLTKYGLVAQAIEAAKKIKFAPAKDESGNPITVTKTVEYTFTIY